MFAYAMITGVKKGWLKDKAYAESPRKAWIGLNKLFIDKDGLVDQGLRRHGPDNSLDFYLNRPTSEGQSARPGAGVMVRQRPC